MSLQFYLSTKSCNVFVNVPVTQLRIVLAWEPVDSAWSSLGVAGAMTLVTQEEDAALKGLRVDPWSSWERTPTRWFLTPVFVQKKRTTSGPLSSVQVRNVWWEQLQFCRQFSFSITSVFSNSFKNKNIFFLSCNQDLEKRITRWGSKFGDKTYSFLYPPLLYWWYSVWNY